MTNLLQDNPVIHFFAKHSAFIIGVIINIVIIYVFCKVVDAFEHNLVKRLKEKNSDTPLLNLMPVLTKIVKSLVVFLLLAGFLQSFGYNVTSLVAGFGITGLAVGFAAKEAIGNIFGSVGLLADRVYKIGEYIKFNDIEGFVEKINLRSTSIRTLDDFLINVPNNVISNMPITNVSMLSKRKVDISVDIEYSTSNEKIDIAIEILKNIAKNNNDILDGYEVFIETLGASAIVIRLLAYTSEKAWLKYKLVKSEIIKEIIHEYRNENISFAFPSTSVYIEKQ